MGLRRSNRGSFAPRKLPDRVLSSAGFAHLAHVQLDLIYVAPAPIFAGLKRLHDGMLGAMKMLGCMLVFRRIATTHMPAFQTQAQMNPGVAHFQTFLAAIWCAGCDRPNLSQMRASRHIVSPLPSTQNLLTTKFAPNNGAQTQPP